MKIVRFLLVCIVIAIVAIPMSSCELNDISKPKEEEKQEEIGVITIKGIDHKIIEAGYVITDRSTIVQFIIADPETRYGTSNIEIQLPNSLTENWYTLALNDNPPGPDNPSWRIILQNIYVGNGTNMGAISAGRVLIKQLGQLDKKNNKYECRIAFEITLTDGTKAIADVHAKFKNSSLWYGGR